MSFTEKRLNEIGSKYQKKELIIDLILDIRPEVNTIKSCLRKISEVQGKLKPAVQEAERLETLRGEYKL